MFTTHQHQAAPAHSTLIFAGAIILGLVASTLFGASGRGKKADPPGLLPPDAHEAAAPMNNAAVDTFATAAWEAIEQQNAENWENAAAIWQRASAPCESEVWRHLSVGVAQLYTGNLELADEQFTLALEFSRENPAVHYFTGLLRIEQAALAQEYEDAVLLTDTRLVVYVSEQLSPSLGRGKSKSRLELEAINELETAVTYTSRLDLSSPLADVPWVIPVPYPVSEPMAAPTVGELLGSLGADNLAGKAHGLLTHLYLDHGRPDQAEYHIDEAQAHGIMVPYAYRLAGELYEEQGRGTDAFRVYLKSMHQGAEGVTPAENGLRSLGTAFEDLF